MTRAEGTFEVKIVPMAGDAYADGESIARMTIDKVFHGDLEAVSKGLMLSGGAPATGSAGYVAIERVTGTLGGKSGGFSLQHSGTMDRGTQALVVQVVPGSGGGALAGLSGRMTIAVGGGRHAYVFEYRIDKVPPGGA